MVFEMFFSKPDVKINIERSDQYVNNNDYYDIVSENEKDVMKQERVKSGLTTLIGAAMQKQKCWERTACTIGSYLKSSKPTRDIFFL